MRPNNVFQYSVADTHRGCTVLVSKTSIHCNSVGCSQSASLHSSSHCIRERSYSQQPLSYSLYSQLIFRYKPVVLFIPFCWSLGDRHCRTTSLFNTIQGRSETFFFHNAIIFAICSWAECSLSFLSFLHSPCVGLLYISVPFLSVGLISLFDPPFFHSWGIYDGYHSVIYWTTHIAYHSHKISDFRRLFFLP